MSQDPTFRVLGQAPSARSVRYESYRREWDRRGAELDPSDHPVHVDLETVAVCDLRCGSSEEDPQGFCQIWTHEHIRKLGFDDHTYKRGYMDPKLYRRLLQQCADIGVSSIKLNYRGEPSLHPEIVPFVALAADFGFPDIMMNTNGNGGARTNPELFAQLVEAGITDLMFSVDAGEPDSYHRQRVGRRLGGAAPLRAKRRRGPRRRQRRSRLPHSRLGRENVHERLGRRQRRHGRVLEERDGRRLDVGERVLFPRGNRAQVEGGRMAAARRFGIPVSRPLPANGRHLGRQAHHALLPGIHARDRRRRGHRGNPKPSRRPGPAPTSTGCATLTASRPGIARALRASPSAAAAPSRRSPHPSPFRSDPERLSRGRRRFPELDLVL